MLNLGLINHLDFYPEAADDSSSQVETMLTLFMTFLGFILTQGVLVTVKLTS